MVPQQITLRVQVRSFDTVLDSLVDDDRVPIAINMGKLIKFLVSSLPQEAQQPSREQCTVFLDHIREAGDEANLIREYLGDLVIAACNSADLPKALSALTGKPLVIEKSLKHVRTWVGAVVAALDEPYITRLVVATLMSGKELPDDERALRQLFLSLQ